MLTLLRADTSKTGAPPDDWSALKAEATTLGKPAWRPMLRYMAELHARGTHPAQPPFEFEWEELGPGYGYGPAFGHLINGLPKEWASLS